MRYSYRSICSFIVDFEPEGTDRGIVTTELDVEASAEASAELLLDKPLDADELIGTPGKLEFIEYIGFGVTRDILPIS